VKLVSCTTISMPSALRTPGERQGGGDDFSTRDEVKVFKDEGEDENEQNASESLHADLFEEKSNLITESERFQRKSDARTLLSVPPSFPNPFGMGYLVNPYGSYANGAAHLSRGVSPLPPYTPENLAAPPPAHMGSLPYDKSGLAASAFRPPLYPSLPHQYGAYGSLGMEQLAAWHQLSMYQQRAHSPYSLPMASNPIMTPTPRFPNGEGLLPSHHLLPIKPEYDQLPGLLNLNDQNNHPPKKEPHIKKPLNAFMLYMKEMRPIVQAECTLKESAAINQILGRRWHGLTKEEQAKYYEKAREERQRHQQLYPNWNARDNYRYGQKPKKRKREKDPAANIKKCRARYGMEQQDLWCKPCKRKKKCIRVQMYLDGHTEQEIEATTFNNEGATIADLGGGATGHGSDGENGLLSPASQGGSTESSEHSILSPAGDVMSIPSLESSASIASPSTPGGSEDYWLSTGEGYKPLLPNYRAVGTDPRDYKNPLSVFSLTGCHSGDGLSGNV